ncbi:YheE family protein [Bacillus sp. FJAT-49736]|uniref:YheE family protein n=1 Tax=Bacillus sp. FJAT-49736 TaxID=2833582 RepID=UPI001BC941C4|nr:YheE family protein [Bacillus sp. FJAT-49736]MBS4171874.1 YheE family protein [Bacillus sp. FJAT-49736]
MIQHFQYKSLYSNENLPGWSFSFYYQKQMIAGIYHPNGQIEWKTDEIHLEKETELKKQIHEIMLFHVYDK